MYHHFPRGGKQASVMALELPKERLGVLRGHEGPVLTVRFNVDGNYCLTGGQDRSIRLWNPEKEQLIKIYRGHSYEVLDVAATSDNSRFVSGGGDKAVFLWDVSTGRTIRRYRGHEHRINCVRFKDDDSVMLSASYDKTIRVWDLRSRSWDPIQVIDSFADSVTSLTVVGTEIVAGSVDGTVRVFDIAAGKMLVDTVGEVGHPVTSVSVSGDNKCVLASSLDGCLRLIDKENGSLLNRFTGHVNFNYKVDSLFSLDDAFVISGSEDGRIIVWDLVTAAEKRTLRGHNRCVSSLSRHPKDSDTLLSASIDGTVAIWGIRR